MAEATAYHESDLDLEEHYTDSHNYTESDFAAFEMVGMPLYAAFPAGRARWPSGPDGRRGPGELGSC